MFAYGKRDAAEGPIVKGLRDRGVRVWILPILSRDPGPDLLCLFNGRWQPLGVKSGQVRKRRYTMRRRVPKHQTDADSTYTANSTRQSPKQVAADSERHWPTVAHPEEALRIFGLPL